MRVNGRLGRRLIGGYIELEGIVNIQDLVADHVCEDLSILYFGRREMKVAACSSRSCFLCSQLSFVGIFSSSRIELSVLFHPQTAFFF